MGLGSTRPTALVTGAAGFLGSHLTDRLLAEGFDVIGIDNFMTGDLCNLASALRDPHFHFHTHDVRLPFGLYAQFIFNFACPASPIHYQHDPIATFTTSVLGIMQIVEMARGKKCRIIQASTSEVYGDPLEHPQTESYWGHVNPIGVRSCYDEGKRAAESYLMDSNRQKLVDARIVRIFNTYGPRMAFNDGRVVSSFIASALDFKPLEITGSGEQTRSFCYVSDLIEGIYRIAMLDTYDGLPTNLGNPTETTIKELAQLVCKILGREEYKTKEISMPQDDPSRRCPDITRAQRLIGFNPVVKLGTGIARTIADFIGRRKPIPLSSSDSMIL
jgi:UDP-glucuronate decarboxylase